MLIETARREANTPIPMPLFNAAGSVVGNLVYYFKPVDPFTSRCAHMADVDNPQHIAMFLAIPSMYREYRGAPPAELKLTRGNSGGVTDAAREDGSAWLSELLGLSVRALREALPAQRYTDSQLSEAAAMERARTDQKPRDFWLREIDVHLRRAARAKTA